MHQKLSTNDYEGFALLPPHEQSKVRRAIAKRLRQRARRNAQPQAVPTETSQEATDAL